MKVIKRRGNEQEFDIQKIYKAVRKANDDKSVIGKEHMSDADIEKVVNTVNKNLAGFNTISTEDIDDFVEKSLMIGSTVGSIITFIIISWLGLMDNYLAIILPAWSSTLGLYLMKNFMDSNVTTSILESARLDGAGEFRTFWSIAMPMVKPAWLTLIIYSFQGLWNSGASIFIHSEELKTLNYAITQILSAGIVRSGAQAASGVIMMAVPIIVFVVSQSKIIETMGTSGMKD